MMENIIIFYRTDEKMDKILEQAAEWQYLLQLPAEFAGFSLETQQAEFGSQYVLFSYQRRDQRSFTVLYDSATKDFLARVVVGLTEYYDLNFISTDFASLERAITKWLELTLNRLANLAEDYESIFRAKKILEWPYSSKLPLEIAGFSLFINPVRPVKTINGSYVVIDYSDFAAASNLTIYYNIYRDEFFGEVRLRHTPRVISLFDSRELADLADKLDNSLSQVLLDLRDEIVCKVQQMEENTECKQL